MRHLWLLRHAKSSWDDVGLPDRLRPLAPRGVRAARAVARHLRTTAVAPDLVLCSPARRAVQTWEGVAPGVPAGTPVEFDEAIYHAGGDELLARLQQLPSQTESVLLVGHNPGLQDLAVDLVASGDPELRERLETKLPTGALVTLEVPSDWDDMTWGVATLLAYVVPREL
ncbi:MAG TPA: histidine phosphatase family protein [Acidimicrobiales bacterium]|nr:histidine phosphatase family protein [Acidimicrobiales bacterium]